MSPTKPKVAFVCVHNSCRSQMAEALAHHLAGDVFDAYSAGTHPAEGINPDAVEMIRQLFDVDMSLTQRPKLLGELPPVDIVITMGCNVECPTLPCSYREDWGLEDPTGKGQAAFSNTAALIATRVVGLKKRIEFGLIPLKK